jgi:hypothetical protein
MTLIDISSAIRGGLTMSELGRDCTPTAANRPYYPSGRAHVHTKVTAKCRANPFKGAWTVDNLEGAGGP